MLNDSSRFRSRTTLGNWGVHTKTEIMSFHIVTSNIITLFNARLYHGIWTIWKKTFKFLKYGSDLFEKTSVLVFGKVSVEKSWLNASVFLCSFKVFILNIYEKFINCIIFYRSSLRHVSLLKSVTSNVKTLIPVRALKSKVISFFVKNQNSPLSAAFVQKSPNTWKSSKWHLQQELFIWAL